MTNLPLPLQTVKLFQNLMWTPVRVTKNLTALCRLVMIPVLCVSKQAQVSPTIWCCIFRPSEHMQVNVCVFCDVVVVNSDSGVAWDFCAVNGGLGCAVLSAYWCPNLKHVPSQHNCQWNFSVALHSRTRFFIIVSGVNVVGNINRGSHMKLSSFSS